MVNIWVQHRWHYFLIWNSLSNFIQLPAKWKFLNGLYKHGALKAAPLPRRPPTPSYLNTICLPALLAGSPVIKPWFSAMTPLSIDLHLPSTLYCPPSNVFFNVSHLYGCSKRHKLHYFGIVSVIVYGPSLTPVLNLAEYRVLHCCDVCIKAKQKLHKTGADCSSIAQMTLVLMTFLVLSSHICKIME